MKYGSPASKILLVGGFDLRATTIDISAIDVASDLEQCDVIGDDWVRYCPTGKRKGMFGQNGFFDDEVGSIHDALSADQNVERVVCVGISGNAAGVRFTGFRGVFHSKYSRQAKQGQLTKASGEYSCSGAVDEGIVLNPLETKYATWNTEGADSQDNGASSAVGGAAYLQVESLVGYTSLICKVRHSADDVTYADLATFATVTTSHKAERVQVAGTVNRHLAFSAALTSASSGSVNVTSSSAANPSLITTAAPHGLATGDRVLIAGHSGSTPSINGVQVVTVISDTTYTIPVNVTVAGTGGTSTKVAARLMAGFARYVPEV